MATGRISVSTRCGCSPSARRAARRFGAARFLALGAAAAIGGVAMHWAFHRFGRTCHRRVGGCFLLDGRGGALCFQPRASLGQGRFGRRGAAWRTGPEPERDGAPMRADDVPRGLVRIEFGVWTRRTGDRPVGGAGGVAGAYGRLPRRAPRVRSVRSEADHLLPSNDLVTSGLPRRSRRRATYGIRQQPHRLRLALLGLALLMAAALVVRPWLVNLLLVVGAPGCHCADRALRRPLRRQRLSRRRRPRSRQARDALTAALDVAPDYRRFFERLREGSSADHARAAKLAGEAAAINIDAAVSDWCGRCARRAARSRPRRRPSPCCGRSTCNLAALKALGGATPGLPSIFSMAGRAKA